MNNDRNKGNNLMTKCEDCKKYYKLDNDIAICKKWKNIIPTGMLYKNCFEIKNKCESCKNRYNSGICSLFIISHDDAIGYALCIHDKLHKKIELRDLHESK